jgi:two-component system chemotaxis response regulator CheY
VKSSKKSTASILAVEDDPGVADLLHSLLNDVDGWGATVAHDAAAARSTFQQVQIDVLVLDIDLPGISGLELLGLLRQEEGWHDQPVIIVSANARKPEVLEAIRAGQVTEALMKPFDIDRLVAVIMEATSRQTGQEGAFS